MKGYWVIPTIIGIVSVLMVSFLPDEAFAAQGQITEVNPSGHGVIREDGCDDTDENCEYNFQIPQDLDADNQDYAPQVDDRVNFTSGPVQTASGISPIETQDDPASGAKAIPDWIDNIMGFYLDNLISENELLEAFNWLFNNNIMYLSQESAQKVQDLQDENEILRMQLGSASQLSEVEVRGWDVTEKKETTPYEKACMIYYVDRVGIESAIVAMDLTDFNFELPVGTLNELEYCVQNNETNFDFVLRLMEEEGVYWFFKEGEVTDFDTGADTLDISDIFADEPEAEPEPIEPIDDLVSASIQDLCFFKTEAEVEAEFDKLDANDTEGLSHDEWDFVQVFEDVAGQEPPNDIVTKKELVDWWKAKCIPP